MSLPAGVRIAWGAVPSPGDRRGISRELLRGLLPGASFVSRCASCGGEHGRVRVEGADAAVSVSYVPGWTVVAVTRDHARIGVDAVPVDAGGLERVLGGAADAHAWARVEAVVKADGRGLRLDPGCVRVVTGGDGWRAWTADSGGGARENGPASAAATSDGGPPREWRGWDLGGPAGVVAAVAVG